MPDRAVSSASTSFSAVPKFALSRPFACSTRVLGAGGRLTLGVAGGETECDALGADPDAEGVGESLAAPADGLADTAVREVVAHAVSTTAAPTAPRARNEMAMHQR